MTKPLRAVVAMSVLLALVAFVPLTADAATLGPSITQKVAVFPPVHASAFGSAIAMDPSRLAVRAHTTDGFVIFVYDRQSSGAWSPAATVDAPAGTTSFWGTYLAISGDVLAISDPGILTGNERHGVVHLYRRQGSVFTEAQTILPATDFSNLGAVWLGRRGLLVDYTPYCDAACSIGHWQIFRKDASGVFQLAVDSVTDLDPVRGGSAISVGVDLGHFVVGNQGVFNQASMEPYDNVLTVYDTNPSPVVKTFEEVTPFADPDTLEVLHGGWYRKVDLSGDILAHEDCCTNEKQVVILKRTGSGYLHDATFPVPTASNGLAVVPGVVLLADASLKSFRTFVNDGGTWQAGADPATPRGVAGDFPVEPVAAADRIALGGGGRVWVLTISPDPALE